MEYREITAADAPALFYVRTRTRENRYTLEQLENLGITAESVAEKLRTSYNGWLAAQAGLRWMELLAPNSPAPSGKPADRGR